MAHYKLYFMDFHGHIARAEDCEHASDTAAIAAAKAANPDAHMELWMGARLVRILMSQPDRDEAGGPGLWKDVAGDGMHHSLNGR
jgi:hypothetical protein